MKKIINIILIGLCLCACNSKSGNKNTNVVEKSQYKNVYWYSNVSYEFDNYMRCNVEYIHYKGDDETGYVVDYTKKWCVYLTGFYVVSTYGYNYFYECVKSSGSYDYYLVVR